MLTGTEEKHPEKGFVDPIDEVPDPTVISR